MNKTVLSVILAIACAGNAYSAENVNIVSAKEAEQCNFIVEDACTTKKVDTEKQCNKWHKKNANAKRANTVVITDSAFTKSKRPSVNGGSKTITTTTVTAKYYACATGVVSNSTLNNKPTATKPTEKRPTVTSASIEKRLLILNALNEKGILTEEEYAAKRAEILQDL